MASLNQPVSGGVAGFSAAGAVLANTEPVEASSVDESQPAASAPEEPAKSVSDAAAYGQIVGQTTKSPHTVPEVIQVTWQVADFAASTAQVEAWVSAGEGVAIATNEHHLSVKLPASRVAEFLAKFSSQPTTAPSTQGSLWVTISLELVLSQ